MRQETAMGVLPRLNERFVPMVGQNALFFKNTNSVIMLKTYLISNLSIMLIDNGKNFSLRGGREAFGPLYKTF